RNRSSNKLGSADSKRLPRYACRMNTQPIGRILFGIMLFTSLLVAATLPGVLLAQQAPVTPSAPAATSAPAKDELRISARAYHEDVILKVADLKAMPRTTVTVHNEHSKAD